MIIDLSQTIAEGQSFSAVNGRITEAFLGIDPVSDNFKIVLILLLDDNREQIYSPVHSNGSSRISEEQAFVVTSILKVADVSSWEELKGTQIAAVYAQASALKVIGISSPDGTRVQLDENLPRPVESVRI